MYFEWNVGGETFTVENPTLYCENPGVYSASLHAFTLNGCVSDINVQTDSAFIIHPAPTNGFTISPNEITIDNPSISIADSSSGAISCVYFTSDGGVIEAFDGQHTFTEFGQQTVVQVLENEFGCKSSATAYVNIGGTIVFVPNAFTPDSDGVNDAWRPEMIGVTEYHLDIYNRWGVKIFETDNPNEYWMGNTEGGKYYVENGSYEYRIFFKDQLSKSKTIKGNIVVLR
jgi:gliding motility-associated-like protein